MNRLKLLTGFEGVVRNNIGDSYLEGRSTEILLDGCGMQLKDE
jgi:hypothetical protein